MCLVDVGLSIYSSFRQSCCVLQLNLTDCVWQFQADGKPECVSDTQWSTALLTFGSQWTVLELDDNSDWMWVSDEENSCFLFVLCVLSTTPNTKPVQIFIVSFWNTMHDITAIVCTWILKLEVLHFKDTEVTTAVRNCWRKLGWTSRISEFEVF